MAKKEKVHGLFAVNKPKGITVYQVLEFINQTFRRHAEATRPEMTRRQVVELGSCITSTTKSWCTGVFIVGVNQGNRLLREQEKMNEIIHATGMLGFSTTTKDFNGTLVNTASASHISRETIADFLPKLVGKVYNREISKTATAPPPGRPAWISHLNTFGKNKKKKLLKEYNKPVPSSDIIKYTAPTKIYRLELKDFSRLHSYHPPLTVEQMKSNKETEKPFDSYASYLSSEEDDQWENDDLKNPTGSLTETMTPLAKRLFSAPPASQSTSPLSNLIKSAAKSETSRNPVFKVEIECSPNTPIEKVIDDIGNSLNSAAFLLEIERVKQGDFILHEDTLEWEECSVFDNIYDSMNDWIRKARKRELEQQLG